MQSAPQPPFPLFDCWSFFCIILTSSTYNIKCREVTRVVIWRHMNFIEISNYSKILSSYSIHATSCAYPVQSKKYDTDWRDASLSQKNTQPFMLTFTPTANLESAIYPMHVFGLRNLSSCPCWHKKKQTPHSWTVDLNPGASCSETVQTTAVL